MRRIVGLSHETVSSRGGLGAVAGSAHPSGQWYATSSSPETE